MREALTTLLVRTPSVHHDAPHARKCRASRTLLRRMTQPSQSPEAPRPGAWPADPPGPGGVTGQRGAMARLGGAGLALLATAAASALLGLLAGLLWSAAAPRALLVIESRGVAYLVNVESTAYIA